MSVSRLFYLLTAPYLYGAISIDLHDWINPLSSSRKLNADGTKKTRPHTPDAANALPQAKKGIRRKIGTILLPHRDQLMELDRLRYTDHIKSNDLKSLPDRFTFTTHLTLSTHLEGVCADFTPPTMPNLEVLRIRPHHTEPYSRFHPCHQPDVKLCHCFPFVDAQKKLLQKQSGGPEKGDSLAVSDHTCSLLVNLRCPELMIGDMTTDLYSLSNGLSYHSQGYVKIAPWIKRVTILAGQNLTKPVDSRCDEMIVTYLPGKIKALTIVCTSSTLGLAVDIPWRPLRKRPLAHKRPVGPLMPLTCSYPVGSVEVVGIETMDNAWKDGEVESHIKAIREGVRLAITRKLMYRMPRWRKRIDAKRGSERIIFTNGDVYARRDKEGNSAEDRRQCETVKRAILSDMVLAIREASEV